jgi:enoyl-CoA hydratase
VSFSSIIVESADRIARIVLNRPQVLNALNTAMRQELYAALDELEKDSVIDVIILSGAGRAFCVGLDFKEFVQREAMEAGGKSPWDIWSKVLNLDRPVIAAVHGHVLTGGLELALACDIIIASDDSIFGDTHARVGMVPGEGNTQILPRLVGIKKAKEMLFTGNFISAQEALAIGLVNKVVPRDRLEAAAREMAENILSCDQTSVRKIKQMIGKGMKDLEAGLIFEKLEARRWYERIEMKVVAQRWPDIQERGKSQTEKKATHD